MKILRVFVISSIIAICSTIAAFGATTASPSDAEQYVESVISAIPDTVSQVIVDSDIEAQEYIESFFSNSMMSKYDIDITIPFLSRAFRESEMLPEGVDGEFTAEISITGVIYARMSITIKPQPYTSEYWPGRFYAKRYEDAIQYIVNNGIDMQYCNTLEQTKQYLEGLAPDNKPDNVSVHIYAYFTKTPIAGTYQNPSGIPGILDLWIRATTGQGLDYGDIIYHDIIINPTPYNRTSSSGGSGGGGGNSTKSTTTSVNTGMLISKESIYDGKWEYLEGKWKLNLGNGLFASAQWGHINNNWYLFDQNGYMLTGWQLINGSWYYMLSTGEMTIGWHKINEKWYFMREDGKMLSDTTTPDGYIVSSSGEWIQ